MMTRVSFGSCGFVLEGSTSVSGAWPFREPLERPNRCLDVGASTMIVNGQIKVKSGPKLEGFDESGATFDDGSRVNADVIVVATG